MSKVKIINYEIKQNKEDKPFCVLILQGGVEMVRSMETGMYYATIRKASVTSTFDEETCKELVGTDLPGRIERVEVEPYERTNTETGEVLTLNHRWTYMPPQTSEREEEKAILGFPAQQQ